MITLNKQHVLLIYITCRLAYRLILFHLRYTRNISSSAIFQFVSDVVFSLLWFHNLTQLLR